MVPELTSRRGPDEAHPSTGMQVLLVLVRAVSLPFFLLVLVLAALIYGSAFLVRQALVLGHPLHVSVKSWHAPVRTRDA